MSGTKSVLVINIETRLQKVVSLTPHALTSRANSCWYPLVMKLSWS